MKDNLKSDNEKMKKINEAILKDIRNIPKNNNRKKGNLEQNL